MIEKELKRISSVGNQALEHVISGDYRKARRVLRKIENSFCVSESMQVATLIHAEIHFAKGELKEMAELIRANLYYLWGIYDGWELLSRQNPAIDSDSQVFFLTLRGAARLGAFTHFPEDYHTSFEVVANSLDEAMKWVEEIGVFVDWDAVRLDSWETHELPFEDIKFRGVLRSYPFGPACEDEQRLLN